MTAVWVVRDKDGHFVNAHSNMLEAMDAAYSDETVTRKTLLTPAHAAVIEAAKVMADVIRHPKTGGYGEYLSARDGLLNTVAALRELEGA